MGKQDPVLILWQILALQCLYYASTGGILVGFHLISGLPLSLERFFGDGRSLTWRSEAGSASVGAVLLSGVAGAVLLRTVVEKSRKCLDFSVTLLAGHLAASTAYSRRLPNGAWWLAHGLALVIMVLLGEYLCARRELREIPLVG